MTTHPTKGSVVIKTKPPSPAEAMQIRRCHHLVSGGAAEFMMETKKIRLTDIGIEGPRKVLKAIIEILVLEVGELTLLIRRLAVRLR